MTGSGVHFDEDKSVKSQIKTELEDLKKMAAAFGPARLRDGSWFNEFVHAMLSSYAEKIMALPFLTGILGESVQTSGKEAS